MSSQFRTDGFYLPWKQAKALKLIANAMKHDANGNTITADSLLEQIATEWLDANHPTVMGWLEAQDLSAKNFAKELEALLSPKISLS